MPMELIANLLLAGFVYIVSPGPVFLGTLSIVADKNRRAGAAFTAGAFLGDIVWLLLTCLFLIGAANIPPLLLTGVAVVCALYLFWMGGRMIVAARAVKMTRLFPRPFKDGVLLGLLNPKSYPVLVSVFSALVLGRGLEFSLGNLPLLMVFSSLGFIAGYATLVLVAGFGVVKTVYIKYNRPLTILFGIIFIGFGVKLLYTMLG